MPNGAPATTESEGYAARTWKVQGQALTLTNASARFLEDLNLLGLEPDTFLTGVISP